MWRRNVDLLAYHDLDGRSGFKLALQEVAGRFFLYVAGFWHSGWSILDVTDPEHPELLRFLAGPPNTMTIQVQVADGTMITALEHPPPGLTIGDPTAEPQDGFLIWDVREPDRPQLLGTWVSGGTGTHRNFYHGGPWVYATSNLPGFEGQILAIIDIADPAASASCNRASLSLSVVSYWRRSANSEARTNAQSATVRMLAWAASVRS